MLARRKPFQEVETRLRELRIPESYINKHVRELLVVTEKRNKPKPVELKQERDPVIHKHIRAQKKRKTEWNRVTRRDRYPNE
jgi:hypothetical protein